MKKIIILLFILISLFICGKKEKKLKDGDIIYNHKTLTVSEYIVPVDKCNYGKKQDEYYFQIWFTEMIFGNELSFGFSMSNEYTEFFDNGKYTIEVFVSLDFNTKMIHAYPIIKYSKKGNNYEKIITIED